jgi:predicted ATPase
MWHQGFSHRAREQMLAAIHLARELDDRHGEAVALTFGCFVGHFCKKTQDALANASELIELSISNDFPFWLAAGYQLKGWAIAMSGQVQEGIELMSKGLSAWRNTGGDLIVPYWLSLQTEAHRKVGEFEKGIALLDEAIETAEKMQEQWWLAELLRLKGELLPENLNSRIESESLFRQSLKLASSKGSKSLELRAAMSLSHLWERMGKRSDAHSLLVQVHSAYPKGSETIELIESRALLETFKEPQR